jgi:cytochrome c biogenesis factor
MQTNKVVNSLSTLLGTLVLLFGLLQFYIAATAKISPESGRFFAYELGGAMLLIASIFLSVPFSKRIAKILSVLFLLLLAASMLRLVFSQDLATDKPFIYQAAAIGLAVLLVARVITSFRARSSKNDT